MMMRTVARFLVDGTRNAVNSVLTSVLKSATKNVIYFHGDIQNWSEEMEVSSEWSEYSLENTMKILETKYTNANIFVVRASRVVGQYAENDNFLRPGQCILHMNAILKNSLGQAQKKSGFSIEEGLPLVLIAFSKGVLVLNHLVAEYGTLFKEPDMYKLICDWQDPLSPVPLPSWEPALRIAHTRTPTTNLLEHKDEIISFMDRIESIHWVDGHRFPTNPDVIEPFAQYTNRNGLKKQKTMLFLHGSPRQLQDTKRKWIAKENNIFVSNLKKFNALHSEKLYFETQPKHLIYHFKVLTVFNTGEPENNKPS